MKGNGNGKPSFRGCLRQRVDKNQVRENSISQALCADLYLSADNNGGGQIPSNLWLTSKSIAEEIPLRARVSKVMHERRREWSNNEVKQAEEKAKPATDADEESSAADGHGRQVNPFSKHHQTAGEIRRRCVPDREERRTL